MVMDLRALGLGMVLALGTPACFADEAMTTPVKGTDFSEQQLATYDMLLADSSPRMQVLAARLSIDTKDLLLRPKVATVVARATEFAPDDPFVQWLAAETGKYWSSECGPVEYPEAAVAATARLEPDNAATIAYSVALAQAKGDTRAVDEALARMASAKRADDHGGEEIAAWRAIYGAHPDPESDVDARVRDALTHALMHATLATSASAPLESACKPDARSDMPWQRLGYCVDAGLLLARKGNSFALRNEGIAMLRAAGATSADLADLERGVAWLEARGANSLQDTDAIDDEPADVEADWHGTPGEIEATDRRLARLGLPSTPPTAWASPADVEAADEQRQASVWREYVLGLLETMRGSSDMHEKALGLSSEGVLAWLPQARDTDDEVRAQAEHATLVALAAAHRDDVLVNWLAAGSVADGGEPDPATLSNLQRIDGENAATWTLSFGTLGVDADRILGHMAASRHWDEHFVELLGLWNGALRRRGVPDDLVKAVEGQSAFTGTELTREDVRAAMAVMFATSGAIGPLHYQALNTACTNAKGDRRAACVATARRMFNGPALLTTRIGAMILRKRDALDANDRARDRQLAWWTQNSMSLNADTARYIDDTVASKSEIEGIRAAMMRAGKLDPPAGWQPPGGRVDTKKD
jgi:hypothetical protein